MARLSPAWQKFKRVHADAMREVRASHRYESTVIQDYRFKVGVDWDKNARFEWTMEIYEVLGAGAHIEWIGNARDPACLVNNVMLFS